MKHVQCVFNFSYFLFLDVLLGPFSNVLCHSIVPSSLKILSRLSFLSLNMVSTIDVIIVSDDRALHVCADWFLWSVAGAGPCYSVPCILGIFDYVLVIALEIFFLVES